jgi:hypothetical protein
MDDLEAVGMKREAGLFSNWTFETFAPGSIPRTKYNAFRRIHRKADVCFELLARFEELSRGRTVVDWCKVSSLAASLNRQVRILVDLLQVMNPVEFMDAHDWFAKISFYARMATEHVAVAATPPYFLSTTEQGLDQPFGRVREHLGDAAVSGLIVCPSLYQYFVEANDLRPELDALLRQLDLGDEALVGAVSEKLVSMILAVDLPERLRTELEIEAMELTQGRGPLEVLTFVGNGDEAVLVGRQGGVRAADFGAAWLGAVACKFSPTVLNMRLGLGLADEEHGLTVLACPEGTSRGDAPCAPWGVHQSGALVHRLERIAPRVNQLHVFRAQGEALRPEQCKSLHDLTCLCLERGLAQVFAFAGEPARGLAGIKQMRLEIPVVINAFNLGGGFFPTAAERAVISMEDVRSIPAWSFLLGLVNPVVSWPMAEGGDVQGAPSMPHYSSYAVLAQFFMHCTLRLEQNLYAVECHCDDARKKYVQFRCMFGGDVLENRLRRIKIVRTVMEGEGFEVKSRGNYLEAVRSSEEDVYLQRNLVCLGLLVAWLQVEGASLAVMEADKGAAVFRALLGESRSNPL